MAQCFIIVLINVRVYIFVQSTEVKNSSWCEVEGFKRSMKFLSDNELTVGQLITDRHRSIAKIVREDHPEVKHWNDVWHTAKGE